VVALKLLSMDFKKEAIKVLKKALPKQKDYFIEIPKDSKLGDVSSTIAFVLAKKKKKNPADIASEIVKKLKIEGTCFSGVTSAGPYINFYFDRDAISNKIINELLKNKLIKKGKPKRVLVEFFHPNTHKGVHIGHTRNAVIGEAISRILEEAGINVIRATYGGDIGPHVAKCLWGYMNLGLKPEGDKGEWLGAVYALASKKINNEFLKKQVEKINKRLYERDVSLMPIWERTREWSINHIKKVLKLLNIKMNAFLWESHVEKDGLKIARQLLKKGVLKESDGAIIADLTKHNLGILVVVSKEGLPLYPAKDLGLVKLEFNKFKVTKIIHVVGVEQQFYFKQLFKIFELAGWKEWAKNSIHVAYELVDLKSGKMSSRTGEVVLFTDLYEKMLDLAKIEMQKRNPEVSIKIREKIAHKITISAIKYGMLSQSLSKKILFDYKDWLSFEGDTGLYIQYSYVRARKILQKIKSPMRQKIIIERPVEYELIKKMNEFQSVFKEAYEKLDPSVIAHYAYRLAFLFNKFYEECPVIGSEYEGSRLKIIKAYLNVMGKVLHLLGLKPMKRI